MSIQNRTTSILNHHENSGGRRNCNFKNIDKIITYYCHSMYHNVCRKLLFCCRKIQTCVHCCMAYIVLFYQTIYIRGLSFFLSLFYLIAYSSANVPIKKSHPRKFPYILYETFNPFFKNLFKFGIKKKRVMIQ